ncbi:M50 family metallopeptidase [Treponema zioleckii]|uniref:M50 family metallopeptidase n=1 Tax=Treponema zioleckii TaxID=331680 RepID=UPI00168AEF8B|nr:site-2 protease family protein [Treponema zioleckii]
MIVLNTILTVIYGLILLNVIVFLHELGHFFMAKKAGVVVEAFSIGMGPILLHKEFRGTDWRISLFPVGGYCAMKGEKDAEEENVILDSDSLYGTKPIYRGLIGLAGPFANLVFAFFAYMVVAMLGYTYYAADNKILIPEYLADSPAAKAGLLSGDKITKVNDIIIEDFADLRAAILPRGNEDLTILVNRNEQALTFTVHSGMDKDSGAGFLGVENNPSSRILREAKRYGFFGAVVQAAKQTEETIALTFKGFATLFKGVKITETVGGPARITTMLGSTSRAGFSENFRTGISSILQLLALISLSLFIMNLLPIPILDGWLVLISFLEAIFKIKISSKSRAIIQSIGIFFILLLFSIALYSDINYFVGVFNASK